MERFTVFTLAALARLLSSVLLYYGDWLFDRLVQGVDGTLDLAEDLWDFGYALVTAMAERLLGRPGRGLQRSEEYEPNYYAR